MVIHLEAKVSLVHEDESYIAEYQVTFCATR